MADLALESLLSPDMPMDVPPVDYQGLGISGGYDRKASVPSDVFPTIGTVQGVHVASGTTKVATMTDDNRLRVDTGGGGGGSSFGYIPNNLWWTSGSIDSADLFTDLQPDYGDIRYVTHCAFSISVVQSGAPASAQTNVDFDVTDSYGHIFLLLTLSIAYGFPDPASGNLSDSGVADFNPALDLQANGDFAPYSFKAVQVTDGTPPKLRLGWSIIGT